MSNEKQKYPTYDDYSGFIKVASFNVEGLREDRELLFRQLREISPDIVGIQELDRLNKRANEDQIAVLAKECGYPYYGYDAARFWHGGQYGNGVLSKFPFKRHTTVLYDVVSETDGDHARSFGRYEFNVNGKILCFYNTHMTLGSLEAHMEELRELVEEMKKDRYAVATGDFNMHAHFIAEALDPKEFTVLNGGGVHGTQLATCPAGDAAESPIDNIFFTAGMKHYWDPETDVGVIPVVSLASDHNMIYTYIDFPEE